ncbi:MAG: 5'-nucleotidase/UDP-sugar diphosphatase [Cryomorphaceae bacterium]
MIIFKTYSWPRKNGCACRFVNACAITLLALGVLGCASKVDSITLIHFSDYHANALPRLNEQGQEQAGIARAIAFLRQQKSPATLIFSGGDMMNKGAPAWSDKYRCTEWPWFNSLVDAMALGNHDSDYGSALLQECREQINFPILSANTLGANGQPAFAHEGKNYTVYQVENHKVGVFALAGNDFATLLKPEALPIQGVQFLDRAESARKIVELLRKQEAVDVVVLIGHAPFEEDIALVHAVNGIDLIFGSHSHREVALFQIPETHSYYISAGPYLSQMSKVELSFKDSQRPQFEGEVVPMLTSISPAEDIQISVAKMQDDLQKDPIYADQFEVIGELPFALREPKGFQSDSLLGNYVCDVVRTATEADVVMLTSSTFRKGIPMGAVKEHHLSDALPYDNKLHLYSVRGAQLRRIIEYSAQRRESDFFSQISGFRFNLVDGQVRNLLIGEPGKQRQLQDDVLYRLVTSDYQSQIATGYSELLAGQQFSVFDRTLRTLVREELRSPRTPVKQDRRISSN